MKYTDVHKGIRESFNDLIGNAPEDLTGGITDWSVQASMMENIKRLSMSVKGGSSSYISYGFDVVSTNDSLGSGAGITNLGNPVYLSTSVPFSAITDGDIYLNVDKERKTAEHSSPIETTNSFGSIKVIVDDKLTVSSTHGTEFIKIGSVAGGVFTPEHKGPVTTGYTGSVQVTGLTTGSIITLVIENGLITSVV